jgi:uncharacterized protein YwgA
MNKQQIGTKLTLDALDVQLKLDTFDQRLIVQKAVYLAKAAGFDCGHFFRWYLRGPYSPELARDAFSIEAEVSAGSDESEGWTLDHETLGRLKRVKSMIPAAATRTVARRLELLASVHFLVDHRQVPNADAAKLAAILRRYGKKYSQDEVAEALAELCKNRLLASTQ